MPSKNEPEANGGGDGDGDEDGEYYEGAYSMAEGNAALLSTDEATIVAKDY